MSKYIASFFSFLFPILRSAIVQVAADELDRLAYPNRRPRPPFNYTSYNRQRRPEAKRVNNTHRPFQHYSPVARPQSADQFHDVLLVAFDLTGPNAEVVHEWLHNQMPAVGDHLARGENDGTVTVNLDSWWVANDERFDRSDNDSAVFVHKGSQDIARRMLREEGLGS